MSGQKGASRARPADHPADELVLAALERAVRHRGHGATVAPTWAILDHLATPRRGGEARRVRAVLERLQAAGQIELSRPHGVEAYGLTAAGRRRLGGARRAGTLAALPEAPQHRDWRTATTTAAQEIERFERVLRERLAAAALLLDAREARSDAWFELGHGLHRACWRLGSATHCLYEWPEPQDERPDLDTLADPGDDELEPSEQDRRRARRMGRRNILLWREESRLG